MCPSDPSRALRGRGIMNGLDVQEWDPATDALLPERARFAGAEDAARGKANAKRAAQRRFGLTVCSSLSWGCESSALGTPCT